MKMKLYNFLLYDLLYLQLLSYTISYNALISSYSFKCHILVSAILSIYFNYFKVIHIIQLDLLLENSSLCTLVSSVNKKVHYFVWTGIFLGKQLIVLYYPESFKTCQHYLENTFGHEINK